MKFVRLFFCHARNTYRYAFITDIFHRFLFHFFHSVNGSSIHIYIYNYDHKPRIPPITDPNTTISTNIMFKHDLLTFQNDQLLSIFIYIYILCRYLYYKIGIRSYFYVAHSPACKFHIIIIYAQI